MRARAVSLLVLVIVLACASAPAAVLAASLEGSNFQKELVEGTGESSETTKTVKATSSSDETNGKSGSTVALVIVIGGVLLLGIAFVIVRDARRVAPASDGDLVQGTTPRHSEAALRRRRAKAKEARRQRKRNR